MKTGQSLKVCLSSLLPFAALQSYQGVTVWAIVYKYHSAVFSWITFSYCMEPSHAAEHWSYLFCVWKCGQLYFRSTVLETVVELLPGMSMSSQAGLLPARTEHGDGEEQERSAWSNSSQGVGTSKSKCHSNRARQKSLQRQAFYTEKCLGSDGSNQSLLMVVSVPSNCAAGS